MNAIHDAAERAGYKTTAPTVAVNLPRGFAASSVADCEFLQLPPAGRGNRCPFSQLSRTTLCELIARKDIRAVRIRRPGATRGKVLIVKSSLANYLYQLAAQSDAAAPTAGKAGAP